MPYSTNTFLFHIANYHISKGFSVTQPFFAQIEYSYQRERFIEVLNVCISVKALGKLSQGDNLTHEITEAARQHHEKNFSNPDDITAALSGMPNGKHKRN